LAAVDVDVKLKLNEDSRRHCKVHVCVIEAKVTTGRDGGESSCGASLRWMEPEPKRRRGTSSSMDSNTYCWASINEFGDWTKVSKLSQDLRGEIKKWQSQGSFGT
jgi:hypothetical protein